MHVDLSRLDGGRLRHTFMIAPGDPILGGYPAEVREPITVDVELTNPSHGTYVMTAALRGSVMQPCRRCLTPVEVEVDDRFRVIYQHAARRDREEGTGDEDIVLIDPRATRIEIGREVRDRLFIETQQFALCLEECRGLCPTCGVNLNETQCECVVEISDSRWAALATLRRETNE